MTYVSYVQCDECGTKIEEDAPFALTITTPPTAEDEWGDTQQFHFCIGSHLVQWLASLEAEGKIEDASQAILFGEDAARS